MKKLFLIFALGAYVCCAYAQNAYRPPVKMLLRLAKNNNISEPTAFPDSWGFMNGVFWENKNGKLIGYSQNVDFGFLNDFSSVYNFYIQNLTITDSAELNPYVSPSDKFENKYFNDADKIVHYSIAPEKFVNDTMLVIYCKYVIYDKIDTVSINKSKYAISAHECFYTVPLNKTTTLGFLKTAFPDAETNEALFSLDSLRAYSADPFYLSEYGLKTDNIKESARHELAINHNLIVRAEYITYNKEDNRIIKRNKFNCRSVLKRIYPDWNSEKEFSMPVFDGHIYMPFEVPSIMRNMADGDPAITKDNYIEYLVHSVLLEKNAEFYKFHVIIELRTSDRMQFYFKKVELKNGEPVRFDLEMDRGLFDKEVKKDGKTFVAKRINPDLNEAIVLTLENN